MATRTIFVKGGGIRSEALASVITKPGHLLVEDSNGKVKPHISSGQTAAKIFAVEDDLQGNSIDTSYAVGALVQYDHAQPGDEVWAFLKDGENVAIGDFLQSGGNGELIVYAAGSALVVEYPGSIVAYAKEALDMSDSSGGDPASNRFLVCII